ncbi:MAG TPA: SpoIIE family protein phosphatase [Nocardioidaceae bacterium]|nr:SpoIIE family protein phosphatase [Nocardioidaceae bacterium]
MTQISEGSVLVCDDTAAKRYVIASWLRRAGYDVHEAETGAQAVDIASKGVDLAVLDVHLPDMSGLDVCARIKADPRTASTPVMHISAIAVEPADRSIGLENGADAYMVDPIEPQEMLSMVRSLLRSSGYRRRAERLATRLQQLSASTLRINVALSAARLATEAAEATARVLDSEAVVLLLEDTGSAAVARTDYVGVTASSEVTESLASKLLHSATQTSVVHAADEPWSAILRGGFDGPWQIWPIGRGEDLAGLVAVPAPAISGEDDDMLVHRITQAVSVAQGNLRVFSEEHRMALSLQRSLLPASLPALPGLVIAARYRASNAQAEVGGDFFDAFKADEFGTVVVIGDVQGHSLEAAVVMAELRYSLRAYAFVGLGPEEVLARTNEVLLRGHPELTATLCMLVFPPGQRSMLVANGGHIPPLILRDGVASYLGYGGTMLGLEEPTEKAIEVQLAGGERILLMTDGLIERRGEDMLQAMELLARGIEESVASTPEQLCDQLMEKWAGGEDDVALIVLDVLVGNARA